MSNYDKVNGVRYTRYEGEGEPRVEQNDATLEELYFDDSLGHIIVCVTTDDGFIDIQIPVLRVDRFDSFVNSIPTFE